MRVLAKIFCQLCANTFEGKAHFEQSKKNIKCVASLNGWKETIEDVPELLSLDGYFWVAKLLYSNCNSVLLYKKSFSRETWSLWQTTAVSLLDFLGGGRIGMDDDLWQWEKWNLLYRWWASFKGRRTVLTSTKQSSKRVGELCSTLFFVLPTFFFLNSNAKNPILNYIISHKIVLLCSKTHQSLRVKVRETLP